MKKQTKGHVKRPAKRQVKFYERTFKPVELVSALIVLGLLAAGTYLFINRSSGSSVVSKAAIADEISANPQPENITNYIKNKYAKDYAMLHADEEREPKADEMTYRIDVNSPLYKPDGYNFYTDYEGGSYLYLHLGPFDKDNYKTRPIDTEVRTTIVEALKAFGLERTGSNKREGDVYPEHIYTGKGLICATDPVEVDTRGGDVICGKISEYTIAAAKAEPFVRALAAVQNPDQTMIKVTDKLVIHDLKIETGAINGFTKATAGTGYIDQIGSATTMFYQKYKGDWKVFKRTQMGLQCEVYNTEEIRQAYKGALCYDAATETEMIVQ